MYDRGEHSRRRTGLNDDGWWRRLRRALGRGRGQPSGRYVARPVGAHAYRQQGDALQRRPSYGGQARRQGTYLPYALAFVVIIGALAGFIYLGLTWATGAGRTAGLGSVPPPAPVALPSPSPAASPAPSPAAERTYVVQAGDTPSGIARQFGISSDALLQANHIEDPRTLRVGQTLTIPPPAR